MTFILVWILVGFPNYGNTPPTTVPPMADLASCERVKKSFNALADGRPLLQCVQVAIPVVKEQSK